MLEVGGHLNEALLRFVREHGSTVVRAENIKQVISIWTIRKYFSIMKSKRLANASNNHGRGGERVDKHDYADRAQQVKPKLYRMALVHLGNEEMAVDAVSETIYRGLISVKKLREPVYFETWMARILINECNKIWRRNKRELSLEALPDTAEDERAYDYLPLKEAIRHLPTQLKEVVIMRYYADYTLAETAKSLDIPQGTVVTRQRRALKLLKLELLEEE